MVYNILNDKRYVKYINEFWMMIGYQLYGIRYNCVVMIMLW